MRRPPPEDLTAVLQGLPPDWRLTSYKYEGMGWIAELSLRSGNRRFQLISDRGYIDAFEIRDGKQEHIFPPEDQRISISPGQVRALLQNSVS